MARFERFVDRSGGPDACHPWTGSRIKGTGYGRFHLGDRVEVASRIALAIDLGRPIAPRLEACHTCDNPPCCNAAHLLEGTRQDNVRDSMAKGRYRSGIAAMLAKPPRGEQINRAKLTDEAVREMRRLNVAGFSHDRLSQVYGVHTSTVSRACRGLTWTHVS